MTAKSRRSEDARVANDRSRSSSSPTDVKRTPSLNHGSVPMLTGLNSHPVEIKLASPTVPAKLSGPVPRTPSIIGAARSRANAPQARDARVPRESVMDFAEFIRSTGPAGDNGPAPLRNLSGPVPAMKNSMDSRRVSAMSNRPRLQAREAAVDSKEDNSDLIDFIRRGPPNSAVTTPRIPRTVAPFRTTMDSDQMSGAVGGRAVDANLPNIRYSQASTNVTDSSFNSQSALLRSKPSYQNSNNFDDEDMMPKRKSRRVRDPYAIDLSDEDEEDYGRPPKPVAKEESLADFLKNYSPPQDTSDSVAYAAPQKGPKKKASAPSLMGRFTRNTSSSTQPSQPSAAYGARSNGADSRSLSSRNGGGRGYIPIQVNMPPGYDKYGPIDTGMSRPPMPTSVSTGRVQMKKFEPREAVSSSTRTSDLAEFLRNSEPPPQMSGAGQQSPSMDDEGNGFSKVFGRRKKSAYA
jgi:hypothetical protein